MAFKVSGASINREDFQRKELAKQYDSESIEKAVSETPGGAAMVATIPADIAQYYGCMLRVAQKLLYLYGFPQIEYKEKEQAFDAATMNQIILCMGVMFGVANAKNGLLAIAKALGIGVEKQLVKKALTKETIYSIGKSISKWFGVKMTKEVFA